MDFGHTVDTDKNAVTLHSLEGKRGQAESNGSL